MPDLNFDGRITVKDEGSKEFADAAARMEQAARRVGQGVEGVGAQRWPAIAVLKAGDRK